MKGYQYTRTKLYIVVKNNNCSLLMLIFIWLSKQFSLLSEIVLIVRWADV